MLPRIIHIIVLLCSTAYVYAQETQRLYLSGKGNDDAVPWEFFCSAGNQSGKWTTIPVPSCWELQGFGRLEYGQPWVRASEQGKYRHHFTVPAGWEGQRVFLVFEGSMTDTQAWVNGQLAGPIHQGSFYRFSYDITELAKPGQENLLEVTVDKESANKSVNAAERRADYWIFGGIFRPVYLEARPPQRIRRVAIDARADGKFAVDVLTSGVTSADRVRARIIDADGNPVGESFVQSLGTDRSKVQLQTAITSPRLWTAETPNLYQVEIALLQGDSVLHQLRQRFGFRTIEVRKGDGVYVNGSRVMLKGSDRHSFWPDSGRCVSEKISRMDVALMKEMNMNAVRMSHYPPDEHFLEVCDEQGLYVLDELAGWHGAYDTPTGTKLIEEMITRDVNHPSVLFWDNGNEGGWNTEVDGEFARWDPQRRTVLHPWLKFNDINTRHYAGYEEAKRLCAGADIYMPTEFLHGLFDGGMGAGLEDYWQIMRESKVCAGGFLWSFVDEAVKLPDGRMDTSGNMAPDGMVGPYRQKEGSFFTIKQIWSPVVLSRDGDRVTVENRYDFTNTDQCRFSWQLRAFHSPDDKEAGFTVIAKGEAPSPSIAARGKGELKLQLAPAVMTQADALAIRVDDLAGREIWTWVWPLREAAAVSPLAGAGSVREDAQSIEITCDDLIARFNRETGFLMSVTRAGTTYGFSNGPRLAVGQATLDRIDHHVAPEGYRVEVNYSGDMKFAHWLFSPGGFVQLDYAYELSGSYDFFGVSFDLPETSVTKMKWLGNGPFRVWKNRMIGGTLNVWENAYNNTVTGFRDWVYPEFKGYYSGVRWMRIDTTDGPILVAPSDPSLFVQVLRPEFPTVPIVPVATAPTTSTTRPAQPFGGRAVAAFPDAGFSILHAIPPIGTKFKAANTTGPQGQTNQAKGEYRGSVRFRFGE